MPLLDKMTCPHCWAEFDPAEILWIAADNTLKGDRRLGPDAEPRFLPTRFTPDGRAYDAKGTPCLGVACPRCHLEVPRDAAEMKLWIVSVVGAPAAGKSFYLGALAHSLGHTLRTRYRVSFTDCDTGNNGMVNRYREAMFGDDGRHAPVPLGELIPKTQEFGKQWYSEVRNGNETILYPRPTTYVLRPRDDHPLAGHPDAARLLCLYDNAGESFEAGGDTALTPVTRHLAKASLLLFLFDPTQDADFRRTAAPTTARPDDGRTRLRDQHTLLTEAANRVRRITNTSRQVKHDRPLFVVVTKMDQWGHLVPQASAGLPFLLDAPGGVACVDADRVAAASAAIRAHLRKHSPMVVDAAEEFCASVTYVGVSALGAAPD